MHVGATLSSAPGARRRGPSRRPAVGAGVLGLGAVAFAATATVAAFRRVTVEGDSMRPSLAPGDRLLVVRLLPGTRLRPGTIVAAEDPRAPERMLVKRVVDVDPAGRVVLQGDNARASTDSRTFGAVARRAVWGVAFYRYAPPGRTGSLRRQAVGPSLLPHGRAGQHAAGPAGPAGPTGPTGPTGPVGPRRLV